MRAWGRAGVFLGLLGVVWVLGYQCGYRDGRHQEEPLKAPPTRIKERTK